MKMNKQEIKELIIIICGLLVLVASVILISGCQLDTNEIVDNTVITESIDNDADTEKEETVEEPELVISDPTNRDYKGDIEYAKFVDYWPAMEAEFDDGSYKCNSYSYQVFYYETADNYNEWRQSLIDRYRAEFTHLEDERLDYIYTTNVWKGYYNKQTVLIRERDDTPYGIVERYFEGSNVWQVEFLAAEATVCIEDGPYKIYWNKWIDKNTKYNVLN